MQDIYGDQPFIINEKNGSVVGKRKNTMKVGINKAFLARLAILFSLIIIIGGLLVYQTVFTVKSDEKIYYAVCYYCGQSKSLAEKTREDLIASGGSGYVVSGGEYAVYGAVYKNKDDALNVAGKADGATAREAGWEQKTWSFSTAGEASIVKDALRYYSQTVEDIVGFSLSVAAGDESAAVAYAYVASAIKIFNEYALKISDNTLSALMSRAAYSLQRLPGAGEINFLAELRYLAQDLILLRCAV